MVIGMASKSNEPSLLELCMVLSPRSTAALQLGGSNSFHRRVDRSVDQDNNVYTMLDSIKRAGGLQRKRTAHARVDPLPRRRRAHVALSLDGALVRRETTFADTPIAGGPNHKRTIASGRRRHSSFCDVLGPEACEQCRKHFRQNRFVRNARWKVARSLPDLSKLREDDLDGKGKVTRSTEHLGAPDIRSSSPPNERLLPEQENAVTVEERRVVFEHNPIAAVSRAQRRRHNVENPGTKIQLEPLNTTNVTATSVIKGQEGTPVQRVNIQKRPHKVPPIVKSRSEPKLSHSQLHRRVMDRHRKTLAHKEK